MNCFRTSGSLLLSEFLASSRIRHGGNPLGASHKPPEVLFTIKAECNINNLLTELARAVLGNNGRTATTSGQYSQYGARTRLVSG